MWALKTLDCLSESFYSSGESGMNTEEISNLQILTYPISLSNSSSYIYVLVTSSIRR